MQKMTFGPQKLCVIANGAIYIGRSVRSTTASVIQIPTTTTPIIPKQITKPRQRGLVIVGTPTGPLSR